MKQYPYFTAKEITCNCGCCANNIDDEFMQMLIAARQSAGIPFSMSSMCRCEKHNKKEGGKPTSAHLSTIEIKCKGGDIECDDSVSRNKIITSLIEAGFTRIGIAKTFIHADNDKTKPPGVIWLYL